MVVLPMDFSFSAEITHKQQEEQKTKANNTYSIYSAFN